VLTSGEAPQTRGTLCSKGGQDVDPTTTMALATRMTLLATTTIALATTAMALAMRRASWRLTLPAAIAMGE